jgi:hypothetical protein
MTIDTGLCAVSCQCGGRNGEFVEPGKHWSRFDAVGNIITM